MESRFKVSFVFKELKPVHVGSHRHYLELERKFLPFMFDRKSKELQEFIEELKVRPEDPTNLYYLTYDPTLDPIIEELEEICSKNPKAHRALERRFARNREDLKV